MLFKRTGGTTGTISLLLMITVTNFLFVSSQNISPDTNTTDPANTTTEATSVVPPVGPTGVKLSDVTTNSTSVTVTWTGSAAFYQVQYRKNGVLNYTDVGTPRTDLTTLDINITPLTPGATYTVRVLAYNLVAGGPDGVAGTQTPQFTKAPSHVTGATAELSPTSSTDDAVVSWTNPPNTEWEYVRVRCVPVCTSTPPNVTDKSATSTTVSLTPGENYKFTVIVISNSVESTAATTNQLTMTPSPVTGVTAELSATSNTDTAVVRWTNPPSTTEWDTLSVTCEPACTPEAIVKSATTTTISGLTPGDSYSFTVTVISHSVKSTPATSDQLTMTPSPVTGVTAELYAPSSTDTAVVRWTNPPSNTEWDTIRVTCDHACTSTPPDKSATSTTISGLTPGETYKFTVTVISDSEESTSATTDQLTMTPSDPKSPQANPENNNIGLTWKYDVAGEGHVVDGFRLICMPPIGSCVESVPGLDIDGATRNYSLSNAIKGTEYQISILAFVGTNSEKESSWVKFNPVELGLEAPSNLRITDNSKNTSVTLEWDGAVDGAEVKEYTVNYTTTPDNSSLKGSKKVDNNTHRMEIGGLVHGYGYTFTVQSISPTSKWSPISTEVGYTVAPTEPVKLVAYVLGNYSASFRWELGLGRRDDFEVALYNSSGGNVTETRLDGTTTTKTFDSLVPDTSYTLEVRSRVADLNPASEFKYSGWVSEEVTTDEDSPLQVTDLNIADITSNSTKLSWHRPADERGVVVAYVIQTIYIDNGSCTQSGVLSCTTCHRRPKFDYSSHIATKSCDDQVDERELSSQDDSSITYTIYDLLAYTNYTFIVWAFNTKEPSQANVSGTTKERAPGAPKVTLESVNHSSIFVSWERVSNEATGVIQGYTVSVVPKHTGPFDVLSSETLEHNITGLNPYTEYEVKVVAYTAYPGVPGVIPAITKQYLPSEPRNLALKLGITDIDVSWAEPNPPNGIIQGYRIQWHPNSSVSSETVSHSERSYKITGLKPHTKYTVSVQARTVYRSSQGSEWGDTASKSDSTGQSSPPIIPITPDVMEGFSITKKTDQISFTLPDVSKIFSKDAGPIISYQVLVIGKPSNDEIQEEGKTTSPSRVQTWAQAKKEDFKSPYATGEQTVSPAEWHTPSSRRKRAVPRTITVGEDKCKDSEVSSYCNGPLKPNRDYCVYLRGWTDGGYSDSHCVAKAKTDRNLVPIIIGVVVALCILVILGGVIYCLRERRIGPFRTREKLSDGPETPPMSPPGGQNARPTTPPPQAVLQRDFIDHTDNMHRDQDFRFSQEYQKVRDMSAKHPNNVAVSGPNTSKNRWVDILPFDHSRVKLLPADEEEGSDYINANYMPGYISKREYIATQGPLPGTLDHFWRMVWEQNVTMVVMLTQLIERGRRKCEQYWPDTLEEPAAYGDLVVTKRAESVLPEYTIRIFDIQMGDITRSVKQFFVSFWPDFGCPDNTESLLNLVRVVRSHMRPESKGPLLVHCSAGVGRTGTYVAVDRLLQHMQDHDDVNIFNLVLEMRDYRCRMVQTEDQYIYIHDCIKEALLSGMSRRYTPDPDVHQGDDHQVEDGPIYENAGMQSPTPSSGAGVDTEMVSLAVDMNGGGEPSANVKNTEL